MINTTVIEAVRNDCNVIFFPLLFAPTLRTLHRAISHCRLFFSTFLSCESTHFSACISHHNFVIILFPTKYRWFLVGFPLEEERKTQIPICISNSSNHLKFYCFSCIFHNQSKEVFFSSFHHNRYFSVKHLFRAI